MRIGEFSEQLKVSRDTVRRWERRGLVVPQRDWAGHRRFTPADVDHVRKTLLGGGRRETKSQTAV